MDTDTVASVQPPNCISSSRFRSEFVMHQHFPISLSVSHTDRASSNQCLDTEQVQ